MYLPIEGLLRSRSRLSDGGVGICGEDRGSAAVEFALVLPLILMMIIAVIQVGLLVKDQLVTLDAARAGARQAAVSADDDSARKAAVDAASGLDPGRLSVSIDRGSGEGTAVALHVVYHEAVSVPLVAWLFPSTVDLAGTAVMRQEFG